MTRGKLPIQSNSYEKNIVSFPFTKEWRSKNPLWSKYWLTQKALKLATFLTSTLLCVLSNCPHWSRDSTGAKPSYGAGDMETKTSPFWFSQNVVCVTEPQMSYRTCFKNVNPETVYYKHQSVGEGLSLPSTIAGLWACLESLHIMVQPHLEGQAQQRSQEASQACEWTFPNLVPTLSNKAALLTLTFLI